MLTPRHTPLPAYGALLPTDGALPAPGAFDSHTHMDIMGLPVDGVLAAARAMGIGRVVNVGCDLPSARWSVSRAAEYPDVYATVAIHPNETASVNSERDEVLAELAELAASPKVVAIGETGLDYYRDHAAPDVQRWWFRAHIELARRTGKPLMIHDRDAHDDVLDILEEAGPWPADSVIFHCFSGDAAMAERCAAAGYIMSFAGNVTFKNAVALQEAAVVAPAELIVPETDAPYLTPVPHRGKPNEPAHVRLVCEALAALLGRPLAEVAAATTSNARRRFRLGEACLPEP